MIEHKDSFTLFHFIVLVLVLITCMQREPVVYANLIHGFGLL